MEASLTVPSALSHEEALAFWYGRVNFEQRTARPSDLKLDRMRTLLRLLGNPHQNLRIVHVAGSKGKGSIAAMLAAVLHCAGYRTGLFTSPHLCCVEERFQVDGRPIPSEELVALLNQVRAAVVQSSHADDYTFFEIATAIGFLHFVRRRVEAAVIEVGLGGRFDSTNVCHPAVSIISSISFDHTQQLGNRLSSIAFEKAGIIKPGRPAVSGAVAPEARAVIERVCRERGTSLRELGVDFHYAYEPAHVNSAPSVAPSHIQVTTPRRRWPMMSLALLGEHQAANASVVVACIEELREKGWHIPDHAVVAGLANVTWPARMEVVGRRPFVVLDCAHNVASADALVETLSHSFPPTRRWLVFAGSSDKDLAGMFKVLNPHFRHVFLTRYRNSVRSVLPEGLAELLTHEGDLPFTLCPTPAQAWRAASTQAGPDDLICITGSVFLAGELRPLVVTG
jgi:dihydrofolate synthase/folylpolyglutamate synthase